MRVAYFTLFWSTSSCSLLRRTALANTTASVPVTTIIAADPSIALSNNTYPDFVPLSSDQAGDCDIFGPLCQTGTVTVGVNLTSTTTTTTVPCSYYLSAQANWVQPPGETAYSPAILWPGYNTQGSSWLSSFGRSPECTSFAKAAFPFDDDFASAPPPALSRCSSNATGSMAPWQAYLPPGILRSSKGRYWDCCGTCELRIPRVRIIFFEDPSAPDCSQVNSNNRTVIASTLSTAATTDMKKQADSLVTAVHDGYTFTSPSLYLQVVGTADVTDNCGQVGAQYTSLIVPLPPGALSSYSWNTPVGSSITIQDNFFHAEFTKAVDVQDLKCPTWGFASTKTGGWLVVAPPFNALIEPPMQLMDFDPHWRRCPSFSKRGDFLSSWAIYDPPYALTPKAGLDPISFTAAAPETTPTASSGLSGGSVAAPSPAQSPSPIASPTAFPSHTIPASIPGTASSVDPKQSSTSLQPTSAAPVQSPLPLEQPQSGSSISAVGIQEANPAVGPKQSSPAISDPKIGGIIYSAFGLAPTIVINPPADHFISDNSALPLAGTSVILGPSGSIGTNIVAFSISSDGDQDPRIPRPTTPPFTVIDGSAIAIGGLTLTVGGNAGTVSGNVFSVAPSGEVLMMPAASASTKVFGIGGQTFTRNPSALIIAGSTLTAGAPAITIDETNISFGLSGVAVIGSITVNLDLPVPSIFKIAGKTSAAYPSALSIDSTAISAGGPALTISGTPVSLEQGGMVLVGTSTVSIGLSVPATTASETIQPFLNSQPKLDFPGGIHLGFIWGLISLLILKSTDRFLR